MDKTSEVMLRTGRPMPVMGLGTWKLKEHTAETVLKALSAGYRMIDTSGDYGTEPGIGEAFKKGEIGRHQYYLVTKVEEDEDSYDSTVKNLEKLSIDFADLMLIHRPPANGSAGIELWKGLMDAKKAGLTMDIGVSNYTEEQIETLADATGELPVVNQIEWSPFGYSEDMLDFCRANRIVIMAYSALTHGKRLDDELIEEIAEHHGKTPAQVMIRWNLQLGTVPLVKANQLKHLKENIDVFDFELSAREMDAMMDLNEEYSSIGTLTYV